MMPPLLSLVLRAAARVPVVPTRLLVPGSIPALSRAASAPQPWTPHRPLSTMDSTTTGEENVSSEDSPITQTASATKFTVPDDVPPVMFEAPYHSEQVDHVLAIRALRAYTLANETLRAHFKISMKDKTKKRGKPRDPVRGMAVLPHIFKPPLNVVVFAKGENVDKALAAGAQQAGLFELLDQVNDGDLSFDVALATPDVMQDVKTVARTLRQKTPSAKNGTIVEDVHEGVMRFARGMLYRTDAHGNVSIPFAKSEQDPAIAEENFLALVENVLTHNLASRDSFIEQLVLSSDQSRGGSFKVDIKQALAALDTWRASQKAPEEALMEEA